jgi:dihydrofolate reductase
MRKLIVLTFLTLDGVMQSDDGPEVDRSFGFTYGGWSTPYFDDFLEQTLAEHQSAPFDFVLGRKTYEQFAAFWPYQTSETFLCWLLMISADQLARLSHQLLASSRLKRSLSEAWGMI